MKPRGNVDIQNSEYRFGTRILLISVMYEYIYNILLATTSVFHTEIKYKNSKTVIQAFVRLFNSVIC